MSAEDNLQRTFEAFRDRAIWLQNCHLTALNLFASDNDKLLGNVAQLFFHDLSKILPEYTIVLISQITDTEKFGKNYNISVRRLTSLLTAENFMTCEIESLSNDLNSYGKLLSVARNKLISHADKEVIFADQTLSTHKESIMHAFFANLQAYCDAVGIACGLGALDFSTQAGKGDVLDLLKVLRRHHKSI